MAVGVLFRTLKAYCTEMRPVMYRAASGMLESCRMRISGSGPAGFDEEEAQPARRTPINVIVSGAKNLKADSFTRPSLHMLEHLFGCRRIFPIRIELEIFLQIRFGVGVLAGAHVQHSQLVVGNGELVVGGDGLFEKRLRIGVFARVDRLRRIIEKLPCVGRKFLLSLRGLHFVAGRGVGGVQHAVHVRFVRRQLESLVRASDRLLVGFHVDRTLASASQPAMRSGLVVTACSNFAAASAFLPSLKRAAPSL